MTTLIHPVVTDKAANITERSYSGITIILVLDGVRVNVNSQLMFGPRKVREYLISELDQRVERLRLQGGLLVALVMKTTGWLHTTSNSLLKKTLIRHTSQEIRNNPVRRSHLETKT